MNNNDPIKFVFLPVFTYLYIVVIFMSFSHVRFKKDHINTRGEKLQFRFKYGNERAFIYGSSPLQCIEITHGDKVDCLVVNRYSKKQINQILEILKEQTKQIQNSSTIDLV
jgi:hypothetical protein